MDVIIRMDLGVASPVQPWLIGDCTLAHEWDHGEPGASARAASTARRQVFDSAGRLSARAGRGAPRAPQEASQGGGGRARVSAGR